MKSYSNSERNIALLFKPSKAIRLFLMVLFVGVLGNTVFGQSLGDYKSVATGNWTTLSSWQYYNGSSWVTPSGTSPQGYPGQYSGTGAVLILAGHIISVQNTGIATSPMGTVTINGTLDLIGDNSSQVDFSFATNNMIVSSGATIKFNDKSKLSLPVNANLQVTTGGISGDCNNNQDVYIGSSQYAVCSGGSSLNFSQVIASGGTLNTTISSNSPICVNDTINLVGGISNTGWTIVSYSWSITTPSGAVITASTQNVSIANSLSGTYAASLTVVAKYGSSNNYTNTETSNVIVNATVAPTGTAAQTFCSSPTVANLVASGTAIKWYATSSGGSALATSIALVNGTHYYATQTISGCESISRFDVTATINTTLPATPGTITGTTAQCPSVTGQIYSIAAVSGASSYTWYVPTGWSITSGQGTTSITVTAGSAGQNGNIQVNAVNSCGPGPGSFQSVAVDPVPSAPGTAGPHSSSCTQFTAQWAYTAYATKYFLDVSTNSGFSSFVSGYNNLDVGNVLNYTLTGLNPGTTYYYRVRAYSNCGTSPSSTTMNYATTASPTTAPTVTAATSIDCVQATLNWNSITNATAYYLDIATDSGFSNFVTNYNNLYIGYYPSGYFAGNLPAGVLYYRVRATNGCNVTTGNSNTVSFQTTAPLGGSVSSAQTICSGTSPANLTLSGYTNTSTGIKWQKSSDAAFTSPTDISVNSSTLSSAAIGNLTANTYFRAVVQNQFGSWCSSNSTSVLITVNNSVTAASSTPTVCVNTAITSITHTVIGFTGIGTPTNLPSGVTPSLSGNTLTISGTPTASGTFNYSIPLTGGSCGAANATGTITVNPLPIAAGTIIGAASVCQGQSGVAYSVPAITNAVSYTWSYSGTGVAFTNSTTSTPTIAFASNATSGNLTVYGVNACGNGITAVNYPITVNARPTPTYTVHPGTASCIGTDVTYTTQGGMSNYVWTVPGVLNTDYSITSGSIGTASSTVTLKWLTSGSKTVTVNYASVCSGISAATNTTTVGVLPNNISSGFSATTICTGGSPQLTFDAEDASFSAPYSITYKNDTTLAQYIIAIPSASAYSFTPGDNPTSNTNYSLVSISNANCTRTTSFGNSGANLIVRPVPTATIAGTTTVCAGASSPNIIFTNPQTVAVTVTYTINGGTNQTVNIAASSSSNVAVSTAASGSFVYNLVSVVYQSTPTCSNVLLGSATVTVNPLLLPPTLGTITQATCVSAGSVVLNGLPASGTLIQTGTVANSYAITGTTMTISGLAAGTYNFSVSNGTCPSASTGNVIINSNVTKIWNGTAWSPSAPTISDAAIINGNYSASSNGDINACSLTINSGTLTIEAGQFVIIQNNLTIESGAVLDVLDQGSLVMVNDLGIVTNNGTGTAKVRRFTTPFKKNDYVYWSTPVSTSAISSAVFPGWKSNYAYEYNNAWVYTTAMTPGKGYIIMAPDPTAGPGGNISEAVFRGKVNNGVYKIASIAPSKSYLLGNPYPSAIDADLFILQNSGVIGGTLYFWTHNTAIQLASNITNGTAGSGAYAYTSDDYASYNITGGTATATVANSGGGVVPSGKIASGQGFFTTSKATPSGTEFVFNNSMRMSSGVTSNSQFFKTKASKNNNKTAAIEKHRLWLNLSNAQGAFKQTLLGYIGGATNGDDPLFDGKTLDGNKFIDFYSVNQNKNLVIQGRALPFDDKDEVPLGYKTAVDGTFTINIEQADGLLINQAIFLVDKLTKTVFNLKTGNYTFSTTKGTFNDRFVLKYSDKTLATEDFNAQDNKVLVAVKDRQIKINASETIEKVVIYDLSGKQVYKNDHINNNELSVANFTVANQVLIVKTTLQNGVITTDKIVF